MSVWIAQSCILFLVYSITLTHTITLPWGPYVISRAGRASPSDSWYRNCCPLGLKAEVSSSGVDRELVSYNYCPEPCCTGLGERTVYREDGTEYTYCRNMEPELNGVLEEEISHLSMDKLYQLVSMMLEDTSDTTR